QEDDLALGIGQVTYGREHLLRRDLRLGELLGAAAAIAERVRELGHRPARRRAAVERDYVVVGDAEQPGRERHPLVRSDGLPLKPVDRPEDLQEDLFRQVL